MLGYMYIWNQRYHSVYDLIYMEAKMLQYIPVALFSIRDPTDGHVYMYIALKEINDSATDAKRTPILN